MRITKATIALVETLQGCTISLDSIEAARFNELIEFFNAHQAPIKVLEGAVTNYITIKQPEITV